MPNVTRRERLVCKLKHWYAKTNVSRVLPPVTRCLTCGDDLHISTERGPYFCCRDCHIEWGYYIGVKTFERPPTTTDIEGQTTLTDHDVSDEFRSAGER